MVSYRALRSGIFVPRAPCNWCSYFSNRFRSVSSATNHNGATLRDAYSRHVEEGKLEESTVQKRVIEFLSTALEQAHFTGAAADETSVKSKEWVYPLGTAQTAKFAQEDARRVAEYTAQLAAENMARMRQQRMGKGIDDVVSSRTALPVSKHGQAIRQNRMREVASINPQQMDKDIDLPVTKHDPRIRENRIKEVASMSQQQMDKDIDDGVSGKTALPVTKHLPRIRENRMQDRQRFECESEKSADEVVESMDPKEAMRQRRAQNIYLHGPVGTGKTMLLDMFCHCARSAGLRVMRKHFYEFVLGMHVRIHATTQERPVEVVANNLADKVDVLCFDEFQITDIQDAVIIPRLFEVLFLRGVAVTVTSNTPPQLLYGGGLNRHVHLPPFIRMLSENCTTLGLGGPRGSEPIDYRRRAAALEDLASPDGTACGIFFSGDSRLHDLEAKWIELVDGRAVSAANIALPMGRNFSVQTSAGDVCRLTFSELCCSDRGEADFLGLARAFRIIFVEDVPKFKSLEQIDMLRRFVKLLDVFYDQRVRLILSADAGLDSLFTGIRSDIQSSNSNGLDDLAWRTALYSADGKTGMAAGAVGTLLEAVRATERTESRLREMRTSRYWNMCETDTGENGAV